MKRGRREWLLALLLGGAVVVWLGSLIGQGEQQRSETITTADPFTRAPLRVRVLPGACGALAVESAIAQLPSLSRFVMTV